MQSELAEVYREAEAALAAALKPSVDEDPKKKKKGARPAASMCACALFAEGGGACCGDTQMVAARALPRPC